MPCCDFLISDCSPADAELTAREWTAVVITVPRKQRQIIKSSVVPGMSFQLTAINEGQEERSGMMMSQNRVVCTHCNMLFENEIELREHCQGEDHQRVIMSDEGRDWSWRAPPRGYTADTYSLCDAWMESGACRYGLQCVEAHGQDELQEWIERFEYRRRKFQHACDSELYGKTYTDKLVDKLVQSKAHETIMCEHVEGIDVRCDQELSITMLEKHRKQSWVFQSKAATQLKAVALLQDAHRAYFHIKSIKTNCGAVTLSNAQEWIAPVQSDTSPSGGVEHAIDEGSEHQIEIGFDADIYGTLRQSVVFDFGSEPLLVRHLCVDVVPLGDIEKLQHIRQELLLSSAERWNENNSQIVRFASAVASLVPSYSDIESEWAKDLSLMYPSPSADLFTLSQSTINEMRLTKSTYRTRMHELLYIEEMARYECMAQFNVTGKLKLINKYILSPNSTASSTAKYASSGELFAYMHLSSSLSEDTFAGRLILNNCTILLLSANADAEDRTVYEALIEDKGKSVIYLRLSATMVSELQLKAERSLRVCMQFQLNRIPYCEWHYAIDKIADVRIVFPEVQQEPQIPWTPSRQWSASLDARLNLKQKEAVVAITTPLHIHLPPVLIIGPFGTGKTFTIVQAIKELVKEPGNRILVCTQSNSAADLYVKDYLHPHVMAGNESARPLRIYYQKRWVATVHQTVQKYCLIRTSGGVRHFVAPVLEDIVQHRIVVVTLSISMHLATLGLPRGFFTHIFLDEAAQAMECEAIMPLALANEDTRIVLAGDHMQLSPEVLSPFAKERSLHLSLMERLYDHYPNAFPCKIRLSEIYRAHEAIIRFTSELFYEQKLIASGKQPAHQTFYPLTFFTSRGEDMQDANSTAFYNNAEVYEIVDRVQELRKIWPPTWGKLDEQSIGIMTPYSDQVLRIRCELRKRRLYGVSVERVLNVQGKQFRAVLLSTVRTRRTCQANTDADFGFLSNSKLLNTAITRAQSLVAVVGDPVSLCTIGRCSKVWERFIQICDEHSSLYGITWSALRSQMDSVELKKTFTLNPLAPEFVPRQRQLSKVVCLPSAPENPFYCPPAPMMMPPPGGPLMYLRMYPMRPPVIPPHLMPSQYLVRPNRMPVLPPHHSPQVCASNSYEAMNASPYHQPMQSAAIPNDFFNLLPPNTSLAEMLLQSTAYQENWYFYLVRNKGVDIAKQFQMLMLTATRKDLSCNGSSMRSQSIPVNCDMNMIANTTGTSEGQSSLPLYMRQCEVDKISEDRQASMQGVSEGHIPQQWQQQINADFANLRMDCSELADEILKEDKYATTYASVLKNANNDTGQVPPNGPRLYQYF